MPNTTGSPHDRTDGNGDGRLIVERADDSIRVSGDVDLGTADEFGRALTWTGACDGIVRLDLERVDFFSAAGVRCFVEAGWMVDPHPTLSVSRAVWRVLDLCRVTDLLGCDQPGTGVAVPV